MSVIQVDNAHAMLMLQNDGQWLRMVINQLNDRYNAYNQSLNTAAQMTAAGISATGTPSDQDRVTALKGALHNLLLIATNQAATPTDMGFVLRDIIGIM